MSAYIGVKRNVLVTRDRTQKTPAITPVVADLPAEMMDITSLYIAAYTAVYAAIQSINCSDGFAMT